MRNIRIPILTVLLTAVLGSMFLHSNLNSSSASAVLDSLSSPSEMTATEISVGSCLLTDNYQPTLSVRPKNSAEVFPLIRPLQARFTYFTIGYYLNLKTPSESLIVTRGDPAQTARIWSVASGQLRASLIGHTGRVAQATPNADGSRIVTTAKDGTVRVWDAANGASLAVLDGIGGGARAIFSPDGTRVAVGNSDGKVWIWNWREGHAFQTRGQHSLEVMTLAFSVNGTRLATGGWDGRLRVWDLSDGRLLSTLRSDGKMVLAAAFSPDGTSIAASKLNGNVEVWNIALGQISRLFQGVGGGNSVVFSPDGTRLLTGGGFASVIWDVASGHRITEFEGDTWATLAASFTSDGAFVVAGTRRELVRVWNSGTGRELAAFEGPRNWIRFVAVSATGTRVITRTERHRFNPAQIETRLWNISDGRTLANLQGREGVVGYPISGATDPAAFSPDGRLMATSDQFAAYVLDAETGNVVTELRREGESLRSPSFSPDGNRLSTAGYDRSYVWDSRSGQLLQTIGAGPQWGRPMPGVFRPANGPAVFAPDGYSIVLGTKFDGTAIWDLNASSIIAAQPKISDLRFASFSPDGKYVLGPGRERTAYILNTGTAEIVASLRDGVPWSGSLSRDGKEALTVQDDVAVRLWRQASGWDRPTDIRVSTGAMIGAAGWTKTNAPVVLTCDPARPASNHSASDK